MFHKDTFRLIGKTFNRFFTLLMIVLIGVAFMMGMLSTRVTMEDSVDKYADENNLQDIQIYSSYGFCDDDIKRLKKQDFVDKIFASKMIDVYSDTKSRSGIVVRVEELDRDVNRFVLDEGRMPQKSNERVMLYNGQTFEDGDFTIGSKLKFYTEDDKLSESLKNTEYTIVGKVRTPAYMAKTLGTSTLKNMMLRRVVFVPNENFIADYYTTVYMTMKDAKGLESFGREYEEFMKEAKAEVSVFAATQQDKFKETLLEEYRQKIEDGEEKLETGREEGQKKLDLAKEKLDDANIKVVAAETQLQTFKALLDKALSKVHELENRYNSGAKPTYDRIKQIEAEDERHRSFRQIMTDITVDLGQYNALKAIASGDMAADIDRKTEELKRENREMESQKEKLQAERAEKEAVIADENATEEEKAAAQSRIEEIDREITRLNARIQTNEKTITALQNSQVISPEEANVMMDKIDEKWGGSIESTFAEYSKLSRDKVMYDAMATEIKIANEATAQIRSEMAAAEAQVSTGKRQYAYGKRQYDAAVIKFNEEIEKVEAELRKARRDLEELPAAKWFVLDRDAHYSTYMFKNNAKQMGAIGIALPIMFYLVAALVCMTTMTRLIDEQRGQIGIYRALGFSKGKVISKYVIYALLATIIGSVLGIFVGIAIFPTVIYQTWRLLYRLPERLVLFPKKNIIICVFAFSALMAGVSRAVSAKSLNEHPSQLLRPKAPKNSKKVFLEYIPFIWDRLPFTSKITARNLIRYKVRFIMTVVGVAGCTGLLTMGWGVKDSISDIVDCNLTSCLTIIIWCL